MDKPLPVPIEDYINNLWRSVTRGAIDWDDVRRLQAESMPKCEPHHKPCNVKIGGVYLCEDCMRERYAR